MWLEYSKNIHIGLVSTTNTASWLTISEADLDNLLAYIIKGGDEDVEEFLDHALDVTQVQFMEQVSNLDSPFVSSSGDWLSLLSF